MRKRLDLSLFYIMCVILFAPIATAWSLGEVKIESSGFLRSSSERSNSTNTLQLGPKFRDISDTSEYNVDLFGIVQISDRSSLTLEAPEIFFTMGTKAPNATSENVVYGQHSLTIGRRNQNWSIADDIFELGIFSPRFTWDPTRPRKVGLTGIFYEWKNPNWRFLAFGSYLNVPERGFPVKSENGKLVTSDPFAQQQYESAIVATRQIPIRYTITTPPTSELILNPSGLMSARYQESGDCGAFVQSNFGYLPINQINLSVLPSYILQQDVVDVQVYPTVLNHYLTSLEVGYRHSQFAVFASHTYEVPDEWIMPELWVTPRIEPAQISSVGGDLFFTRNIRFRSALLYINEDEKEKTVKQDFTVDLPNRFQFHRAARTALEVYGTQNLRYELEWTRDLEFNSDLFSVDVFLQFLKKSGALTLNLGSDFFTSSTGSGAIGRLKGNDRVRGGLAYAF